MFNKTSFSVFLVIHIVIGIISFPTILFFAWGVGEGAILSLLLCVVLTQISVPVIAKHAKKPKNVFLLSAGAIHFVSLAVCLFIAHLTEHLNWFMVVIFSCLLVGYYVFVLIEALFVFDFESICNFVYYHNTLYIIFVVLIALLVLSFIILEPWSKIANWLADVFL